MHPGYGYALHQHHPHTQRLTALRHLRIALDTQRTAPSIRFKMIVRMMSKSPSDPPFTR